MLKKRKNTRTMGRTGTVLDIKERMRKLPQNSATIRNLQDTSYIHKQKAQTAHGRSRRRIPGGFSC